MTCKCPSVWTLCQTQSISAIRFISVTLRRTFVPHSIAIFCFFCCCCWSLHEGRKNIFHGHWSSKGFVFGNDFGRSADDVRPHRRRRRRRRRQQRRRRLRRSVGNSCFVSTSLSRVDKKLLSFWQRDSKSRSSISGMFQKWVLVLVHGTNPCKTEKETKSYFAIFGEIWRIKLKSKFLLNRC